MLGEDFQSNAANIDRTGGTGNIDRGRSPSIRTTKRDKSSRKIIYA
jgi:hypothetical protein